MRTIRSLSLRSSVPPLLASEATLSVLAPPAESVTFTPLDALDIGLDPTRLATQLRSVMADGEAHRR